ncbi:tether containing UBX domain for GLUT4 isoform X2 [Ahaetulla prasina]|uniref:tether containing UBX domain for GLUT4 isoform X2 n=1 Tax=Ahaetulla prasina TaxID=499056 RepID=UPI002649BC97|nr:tether containing UBX domain for GLUT4 isoform X2 [Ahaetulla prasina]
MSAAGGGATSAVSVLAPNGRRVTVRVGPSTALIQVLEEVCRKQNFSPNEYDLKFQRTILDLSLQWRFANLPNNAKLEMVPISSNRVGIENTIRIALQLDDGSRLQDTFSSSQTLWDILHHFAQTREYVEEQSEVSPVCIYMRDEVSGKTALERKSLKSLGLTGGNAIIRVNTKKAVSSDNAEGGSNAILSKEVPEGSVSTKEPEAVSFAHLPAFPSSSCSTEAALTNQCTDKKNWSKGSQDNSEELRPPSELMPTSFVPFMGSGQYLGGGCPTPMLSPVLTNQPSSLSSPGGPSKPKKSKNSQEKLKEQKEHLDREPIVCHPDLQEPLDSDSQDLPDEFFEVTVDDVRKRLAQLQNERRCLEEGPLMTKAQREAQTKEKLERYPKVVLRVYFPDRHILQGFFHPSETVGALRAFVKSLLVNPEIPFYLFITPPRSILSDDGMTLFQANLFPAAIVYFGSEVHKDHYLRLDLLESAVSPSEADILVARRLSKLVDHTAQRLESAPSSSLISNEANQNTEHSESANLEIPQPQIRRAPTGKVPKWLKLPGGKR